MSIRYRNFGLSLAIVGSLFMAACEDSMTEVEDHAEAASMQLVMNGTTIATFTWASNSWAGEMEVEVGEETPHIDVRFYDADGDEVMFDTTEFYLMVEVEDETIAEFEQDTPGEFGGHLHGEAAGETDVTFSVMHGSVGSGHADLVTAAVHAHVETP
ncbi:MAG: hypothetical protein AAF389_01215 [Gemmatimonadota bacterium]